MTRRQQIQEVFNHRQLDWSPVSVRIDLWYRDAVERNVLPAEVFGLACEEIEDALGFCRAVRHRSRPTLKFRGFETSSHQDGEFVLEEYHFPEKTLLRKTHWTDEMQRQRIQGHIVEYPLQEKADYQLFLKHLPELEIEADIAGYEDLDRQTGDAGWPVLILSSCPAHLLMIQFAGYEQFYLHKFDFGDTVDALIQGLDELYRKQLWPAVEASPARLVMHGDHFSSQMTSPPIFEKYFLPYFSEFNSLMHARGKKVICHADAEMKDLLQHVLRAGYDGTDCLATHPLIPQHIEDYFFAWQGEIVCWGGLPSIIFNPSYPLEEFDAYVDGLIEKVRGRNDFIFGISDNLMPGAEWERLLSLSKKTSGPFS